jgi:hypothetical protein
MKRSSFPLSVRVPRRILFLLGALALFGGALRADTLLSTTNYSYSGTSATYTVPANTDYVVVKAWGAGGGRALGDDAGGGGFVTASYAASAGQTFTIKVGGGGFYGTYPNPGGGGWNGGGNATDAGGAGGGFSSIVASSWAVYAGGGGGAGWGAAGAPGGNYSTTGLHGTDTASAQGGGTATYNSGGYGGDGDPDFGENGEGGSQYQGGHGGYDGSPSNTWYVDLASSGGGGGGGYYGGGGGGTGDRSSFAGGGGGGSSLVTGSPTSHSYAMGSGATPGGTGDASYPGGGKAYGSTSSFTAGGHGYVVILAYRTDAVPTITGGSVSLAQSQNVDYAISASGSPAISSYGATGLPSGLSLNTSTGHITGSIGTAGSYSSTISATNSLGTSYASLGWSVTAAVIHAYPSVTPQTIFNSQSVHLNSDGTTNFGFGWTENVVWKPGGGADSLGSAALGAYLNYTPAAGPGTYTYQFRLVDQYSNYVDEWVDFYVTAVSLPPTAVSVTGVTSYSVSLSWSGASALAGINHYNIYRDGTLIGTATGTTYTDSTAAAATSYSYTIKTVDNNSVLSAASSVASTTTANGFEMFTPQS